MEGLATTKEVDELKKSIHDLVEMAKKKDDTYQETIQNTLIGVLKNHPGFTPERKVEFEETNISLTPEKRVDRIIKKMPVELRKQLDDLFLLSKMVGRKPNELESWQDWKNDAKEHKKALDATVAGGIDEWVPTDFSSELYAFVRLQTKVAALFRTVVMPSNPYTFPIQLNRLKSYKHTEQSGDSGQTKLPLSDSGVTYSGNFTLTAEGHGTRLLMSKDAEEDSIVPLLAETQAEIIRVLAEGREDFILNGDIVTGTHMDTDVTDSADRRKIATGLRKMSNANGYTADLSTFNVSNLRNLLRAKMGKYGATPSRLTFVTGIKGMMKFIDFPEVTTVDKYGAGATILAGELGNIDGIPIVVSEWVREDLNASAVYLSGSIKTLVHLIFKDGFIVGERRKGSIQLLKELYAESDQDALVIRERVTWRDTYPIASNKTVYTAVNV